MTLQEVFDQRVASFRPLLVEGFVSAVTNDTLTERQLGIYLAQDIHYLEALAKGLLELQAEFTDTPVLESLGRHSSEALTTCFEMRRLLAEFPGLSTMARDPNKGREALLKTFTEGLRDLKPRPYIHNHVVELGYYGRRAMLPGSAQRKPQHGMGRVRSLSRRIRQGRQSLEIRVALLHRHPVRPRYRR